jgi:hypothetical protein
MQMPASLQGRKTAIVVVVVVGGGGGGAAGSGNGEWGIGRWFAVLGFCGERTADAET